MLKMDLKLVMLGNYLIKKKIKLHAVVDCCTSGSLFKFIKGKYPKK